MPISLGSHGVEADSQFKVIQSALIIPHFNEVQRQSQ